MKKLFVLSFILILSSFAYSQQYAIDKGAAMISGLASFSSEGGDLYERNGDRYTIFTIAPSYNKFVAKNIFLGATVAYSHIARGGNSTNSFSVGPALGYAFGEARSKSYPFIAAGVSYYSVGSSGSTSSGHDINLGGGIIYTTHKHIGIVIEANYHMMSLESTTGNVFAVGVGITGLLF